MALVDRLKALITSTVRAVSQGLQPGASEQDWSGVAPTDAAPNVPDDLPADGWVVVETAGEPTGYGVLRRGDTLVRFHESCWKCTVGLAVTRAAGVEVRVSAWEAGRGGRSPEAAQLLVPRVDLPEHPMLAPRQWLECLQRQELLRGVSLPQLIESGVDEGWLEDFWDPADESPTRCSLFSTIIAGLASEEVVALREHGQWVRRFEWREDDEQSAAAVAAWLGVELTAPRPTTSFTELLLVCNQAAASARLPVRLFRVPHDVDDQPVFLAVRLPVPACSELVLGGALDLIAPTADDDDYQWRHDTLAALACLADETGHREFASVLYVESMELAERAMRSDPNGAWKDHVARIREAQLRRA